MRLRLPLVFGMSLIMGLVNAAPTPARNDTALAERQQNCPFGHVVTLWVEERTTITPWGAPGLETLQGGPGVHYDFGFQAGKYDTEHFILRTFPDGVTNPESTDIGRYDCYIRAPAGVPGDCFEISVRHAWPYISGGKDTLTTECWGIPWYSPLPPTDG